MPRAKYEQANVNAALDAIRKKQMSVRQAAATFSVPRSTLMDKMSGRYPVQRVSQTVLTAEEEEKLVRWMVTCARAGEGKDREQLCLEVQRVLNAEGRVTPFTGNKPGYCWFKAFMERHKAEVRERKAMSLGEQRAQVTEKKIRGWFHNLQTALMEDGIDVSKVPPSNVFNCDETGFPFYLGSSVIIADIKSKHPYQVGSDTKTQVTVLGCCSADGKVLKPTIIFPGARWTWKPWEDFDADYALTPNGWINNPTFLKWLQYTFLPAVDHLPRPVILYVDGHTSHYSPEVYDFLVKHSLTMYVLPSHSSHIVQPLDLVFYGCLKEEWKRANRDYRTFSRHANVNRQTFSVVFADAWKQAYSPEKIVNAFVASGLCPWNPDRPDYQKCQASEVWAKTPVAPGTIIEGMVTANPGLEDTPSTSTSCDVAPLPTAQPGLEDIPSTSTSCDVAPPPTAHPGLEDTPSTSTSCDVAPPPTAHPGLEDIPSCDVAPPPTAHPGLEDTPSTSTSCDVAPPPTAHPGLEDTPSTSTSCDVAPPPTAHPGLEDTPYTSTSFDVAPPPTAHPGLEDTPSTSTSWDVAPPPTAQPGLEDTPSTSTSCDVAPPPTAQPGLQDTPSTSTSCDVAPPLTAHTGLEDTPSISVPCDVAPPPTVYPGLDVTSSPCDAAHPPTAHHGIDISPSTSPPWDMAPPPTALTAHSYLDVLASTSASQQNPDLGSPASRDRDNVAFYTCQLIDHIIACGWSPVDMFHVRRRQFRNIPATASEPDYGKYLELWNKVVPQPTFDNLPLPVNSGRKSTKAPRVQPPSYVSHVSFKEFHDNKEKEEAAKKREQEERKAEMLRKREEKMKKKLEEKETKRLEREQKKAEKLEEKRKEAAKKGTGKGKGKKRRVEEMEESMSSSEEENTQVVYDDRSDIEMDDINELCGVNPVDESVCDFCGSDRDLDGWIGCECGRWYHRGCTGREKEKILAMSEEEISVFQFKCTLCE